jgi:hypothetical protein
MAACRTTAPPNGLRGLDKALLAISGVEDEVNAPAAGQFRDFGGYVLALGAGLVISSGSTPQSIALARQSGAHHVFDYKRGLAAGK